MDDKELEELNCIPLSQCKPRYLYKIDSRNLSYGVFTGSSDGGFIGIRQKFGNEFLFMEEHADAGGTVYPKEELVKIPDDIQIVESLGTKDITTDRLVVYVQDKGWRFTDEEEANKEIIPCGIRNGALYHYLSSFQYQKSLQVE